MDGLSQFGLSSVDGRAFFDGFGNFGIGGNAFGKLPQTDRDYETEIGPLWRHSIVSLSIGWIARNFFKPKLVLQKRQGADWLTVEAPFALARLMARPNPRQTWKEVAFTLVAGAVTDGNVYFRKVRQESGIPVELWQVFHDRIGPVWPSDGKTWIAAYEYQPGAQRYGLWPSDVIHYRQGSDPRCDRYGIAPLKASLRAVYTDSKIEGWSAALMRNFAVPSMVVSPEVGQPLDPLTKKDWEKSIQSAFAGDEGGSVLVPPIKTTIQNVGYSPDELAVEKLSKLSESRITAAIGVNCMTLGLNTGDDQRTYSNLDEAEEHSHENAVEPLQEGFAEALGQALLPDFFGSEADQYRFAWDRDGVNSSKKSQAALHDRVRSDWESGLLTLDQACAKLKLPAVGGELGSQRYFQVSRSTEFVFSPASKSSATKEKQGRRSLREPGFPAEGAELNAAATEKLKESWADGRAPYPQDLADGVEIFVDRVLQKHRADLSKWLAKQPKDQFPLESWPSLLEKRDELQSAMELKLAPIWQRSGGEIREDYLVYTPIEIAKVRKQAKAAADSIVLTSDLRVEQIWRFARDRVKAGKLTSQQAHRYLRLKFRELEAYLSFRSKMIATTESLRAWEAAAESAALGGGEDPVVEKEWATALNPCRRCARLAGTRVKIGEPFLSGASRNPDYAVVYSPPLHPSCRCRTLYVRKSEL